MLVVSTVPVCPRPNSDAGQLKCRNVVYCQCAPVTFEQILADLVLVTEVRRILNQDTMIIDLKRGTMKRTVFFKGHEDAVMLYLISADILLVRAP